MPSRILNEGSFSFLKIHLLSSSIVVSETLQPNWLNLVVGSISTIRTGKFGLLAKLANSWGEWGRTRLVRDGLYV